MKNAKPFIATSLLLLVLFGLISSHCTPETGGLVPSTEEVLVRNVWSVDYYSVLPVWLVIKRIMKLSLAHGVKQWMLQILN